MAKVVAVTNQKGGVGKTTTAFQLGAGLAKAGYKVLFVDTDPQCNLTYAVGHSLDGLTVMDLLLNKADISQVIFEYKNYSIIPSSSNLGAIDQYLTDVGREQKLREKLTSVREYYDYIIIDSPPTLGFITISVLTASDLLLIPSIADIFSLQGIGQLQNTVVAVQKYCNPSLKVDGIVLTRYTDRMAHNREIRSMLNQTAELIGTVVYKSTIRESVTIREAETMRKDVFTYAPRSKIAQDYINFVNEFLSHQGR